MLGVFRGGLAATSVNTAVWLVLLASETLSESEWVSAPGCNELLGGMDGGSM